MSEKNEGKDKSIKGEEEQMKPPAKKVKKNNNGDDDDAAALSNNESRHVVNGTPGSIVNVDKKETTLERAGPLLMNMTDIWVNGILPFLNYERSHHLSYTDGIHSMIAKYGNFKILKLASYYGFPFPCLSINCKFYTSSTSETGLCSTCSNGITPEAYGCMITEKRMKYQEAIRSRQKLVQDAIRNFRPLLSKESFECLIAHMQRK